MNKEMEEILRNRAILTEKYVERYGFSLLDLCRIFEVSPLGMKSLLKEYGICPGEQNHPDLTSKFVQNIRDVILSKSGEENPDPFLLAEYGLYRFPVRFCMADDLDDKTKQEILFRYREEKGPAWNRKMEKNHKTLSYSDVKDAVRAIYELYFLGFKRQEIMEYASSDRNGALRLPYVDKTWTKVLIKTFSDIRDRNVSVRNTRKTDENGNTLTVKCNLPVQIATDEELLRFFIAGCGIEQMVMLTGDKEITITAARERLGIQKSYEVKKPILAREMFYAYLEREDLTMETIAARYFNCTRGTFYHNLKLYLKTATEEEKDAFERRKEIAGNLRKENVSKARRKDKSHEMA